MVLWLLVSCATRTYYLRSADNGFSDTKISDTVYLITVKSRNVKEAKRLQDIFYLRAAEIAKEKGYPFFYTVADMEDLSAPNPKNKPFKQNIIYMAIYETITISGVVKLLEEKPDDLSYPVYLTEDAYNQREYLLIEKENTFGK